jgi:hypothetical protein
MALREEEEEEEVVVVVGAASLPRKMPVPHANNWLAKASS